MGLQHDVDRPARGYLPTLDGWRTLSIAAVIFCHDRLHQFGPFSTGWLYRHGNLGVDIFFTISGLLICSRLLDEEQDTGSISIQSFYLRRAFRILPPAIAFLATLAVLSRLIHLPVGKPEIFASLFFVRNYTFFFQHLQSVAPFYTSHFWSLAVEEHFYLILPALLVFAPKRWRVPFLLFLASAVGLHRFVLGASASSMHTDTRLDALVIPAALAILLRNQTPPLTTHPLPTPLAPAHARPGRPDHRGMGSAPSGARTCVVLSVPGSRNHAPPHKPLLPLSRTARDALSRKALLQHLPLAAALLRQPLRWSTARLGRLSALAALSPYDRRLRHDQLLLH
jgi:peptidoglycan/LPS O-acetylase OafA/YrhL